MLNLFARRFLHGRASRQLARAIPNPVLRAVAVSAVTALIPVVVAALSRRRNAHGAQSVSAARDSATVR